MVSGGTIAALGAVVFAGAAGGYYLYMKTLRLSVSYDQSTGIVTWTAGGGTPSGAYTIALGGLLEDQGNFDASGNASGTLTVPSGTPSAQYEILLVDNTTGKFKGIYLTLA